MDLRGGVRGGSDLLDILASKPSPNGQETTITQAGKPGGHRESPAPAWTWFWCLETVTCGEKKPDECRENQEKHLVSFDDCDVRHCRKRARRRTETDLSSDLAAVVELRISLNRSVSPLPLPLSLSLSLSLYEPPSSPGLRQGRRRTRHGGAAERGGG